MFHLDDLDAAKKIAQNFLTMIFTNQEVVAFFMEPKQNWNDETPYGFL